MTIIYYTSGLTGSGRLVLGIAIHNALLRAGIDCTFIMLHSAPDTAVLGDMESYTLPMESPQATDPGNFQRSAVFNTIENINPDLLIVDLLWQPIRSFVASLSCKTIFLCRQVAERFFNHDDGEYRFSFEPGAYDEVLAIEPFRCPVTEKHINPIILRNSNELFSREEACRRLHLDQNKKHCLFSCNMAAGLFDTTRHNFDYLEQEGFSLFDTSLHENGIFPVVDYFNAFDKVVCSAGYNAFWETRFFKKDAVYVPMETRFEDQQQRIDECSKETFSENGADQLVGIIGGL